MLPSSGDTSVADVSTFTTPTTSSGTSSNTNTKTKPKELDPALLTPAGVDSRTGEFVWRVEDQSVIQRLRTTGVVDDKGVVQVTDPPKSGEDNDRKCFASTTVILVIVGLLLLIVIAVVVLVSVLVLTSNEDSMGSLIPINDGSNGTSKDDSSSEADIFQPTPSPNGGATSLSSSSPTLRRPTPAPSFVPSSHDLRSSLTPAPSQACSTLCQDMSSTPTPDAIAILNVNDFSATCGVMEATFDRFIDLSVDLSPDLTADEICLEYHLLGGLRCGCGYPLEQGQECVVLCEDGSFPPDLFELVETLDDGYQVSCLEKIRRLAPLQDAEECAVQSRETALACGCSSADTETTIPAFSPVMPPFTIPARDPTSDSPVQVTETNTSDTEVILCPGVCWDGSPPALGDAIALPGPVGQNVTCAEFDLSVSSSTKFMAGDDNCNSGHVLGWLHCGCPGGPPPFVSCFLCGGEREDWTLPSEEVLSQPYFASNPNDNLPDTCSLAYAGAALKQDEDCATFQRIFASDFCGCG